MVTIRVASELENLLLFGLLFSASWKIFTSKGIPRLVVVGLGASWKLTSMVTIRVASELEILLLFGEATRDSV
jgi:hypothetical protein